MDQLKIIKTIVFIMTFLLIFGIIMLVNGILNKQQKNSQKNNTEINLQQPKDSSIKNIVTLDNKLYILISGGGLPDRIVVIDANSGKKVTDIKVN